MFKQNQKHNQPSLYGAQNTMLERKRKKLQKSEEYFFYKTIFCNIKEEDFRVLYSNKASRPNAPVNCLLGAIILKQKNNWSYSELFRYMEFDQLTQAALGIDDVDDMPFDDATIFNFQNRLHSYEIETGINLLERVFDSLTQEQLQELKIRTNIQRSDSLMASSCTRDYSRVQLLVEVILRLYRTLTPADKERFSERFQSYIEQSSSQYIHGLKGSDLPHELDKLAELYYYCQQEIMPVYQYTEVCAMFDRVYSEQFTEVPGGLEVKPSDELHSGCLQSPDDLDATYRQKRGKGYKGQSINIVETAHPDNPINLVTDVVVSPNNIDDSRVLNGRIDLLIEKTPDLEEIHTDGGYGSAENDIKFESLGITHIQTAVKGIEANELIEIEQDKTGKYHAQCPLQRVEAQPTRSRFKACFDKAVCKGCPYLSACPVIEQKQAMAYYFTHEDYLLQNRRRAIKNIPWERRKLRPNIESTVHCFTCRMTNKKLKYRGSFKTEIFAFAVAIAINCGRIYRYLAGNSPKNTRNSFILVQIVKEMIVIYLNLYRIQFLVDFHANLKNQRLKFISTQTIKK